MNAFLFSRLTAVCLLMALATACATTPAVPAPTDRLPSWNEGAARTYILEFDTAGTPVYASNAVRG